MPSTKSTLGRRSRSSRLEFGSRRRSRRSVRPPDGTRSDRPLELLRRIRRRRERDTADYVARERGDGASRIAAWHADNLEGFLAEVHPEVEWHGVIEGVVGGKASTYRGHEGARQGWAEYRGEAFGRLELRAEEIRDLGESVLLLGRFVVTGRTTALEFDQEIGEIYTFSERKIVTVHDFPTHAQALEAAGVRE